MSVSIEDVAEATVATAAAAAIPNHQLPLRTAPPNVQLSGPSAAQARHQSELVLPPPVFAMLSAIRSA